MAKKKKGPVKKNLKKKPVVKKKLVKKPVRKKSAGKTAATKAGKKPVKKARARGIIKKLKQDVIGKITHYFPKVRAAVIKLQAPLSVGDTIKIKGHTTDFVQAINSMQIDHVVVDSAKKGDEIGLLVNSRVRQHDIAYKQK